MAEMECILSYQSELNGNFQMFSLGIPAQYYRRSQLQTTALLMYCILIRRNMINTILEKAK